MGKLVMIGVNTGLDPSGQILMGRTNDQMATKDDEPPNSGLWGHVEVEALPNPGSLPPPPPDATPIQRGTLMGFAVPPAVANANATQPGPMRRTPNSGTTSVRSNSKTLTSGVVPPINFETAVMPPTSPIGAFPKDTVLGAGGEPQARSYYHASQASRTLIGGSVPAPANSGHASATGRRGTAPGFSTLPEPSPMDKSTLVGVAISPSLGQPSQAASEHPTHRSPATHTAVSTERELRAAVRSEAASGPAHPSGPPYVGTSSHLGRFRIQKRLGAGGVGAVYLASKVDASGAGSQLLAVKVLREHFYRDPSTLKALFREARLAARMDHRHIVRVFDIGYHNKHPYLVMEYVDGLSLTTLLDHGTELPLGVGIRCLIDALHGLDFAHKLRGDEGEPLGLVHCDVSPQNILVGVDGVAKVTDFGVARTREEDGDEFVLRCKPEFAAPELLLEEPVRPETDVFSAGAVLYRIATGRPPFPGETEDEIVDKLLNSEPLPPTQVKEGLPAFLDTFCAQAMSKSVSDRFRTCLDMARSLERQAEAAGLLADRLTVGTWVQKVRRAMEHGEAALAPARRSIAPIDEEVNGAAPTRREPRNSSAVMVGAALATLAIAGGALWWWLNWYSDQRMEEQKRELGQTEPALTLTRDLTRPPTSASPVTSTPQPPAPTADSLGATALKPVASAANSGVAPGAPPSTADAARLLSPQRPSPSPVTSKNTPLSPATAPRPVARPAPVSTGANTRAQPATATTPARPSSSSERSTTAPLLAPATAPKPASTPAANSTLPRTPQPPTVGSRGF